MAMLNNRVPHWVRAEYRVDYRDRCGYADVGVRVADGWVHLLHLQLQEYQQHDRAIRKTRLEVLQEAHQHITTELAKLTLEET